MSIPGIETQDHVPPPLPPPRFLPGTEPLHHLDEMKGRKHYGHGGSSFASGYGSMGSSMVEDQPSYRRGDAGSSLGDRDEGYSSYSTDRYALVTPRGSA